MSTELVYSAINSLLEKGLEPNVARIKAELGAPVALPIIINSLKRWQQNPDVVKAAKQPVLPQERPADVNATDQPSAAIQAELTEIKQLLQAILAKL